MDHDDVARWVDSYELAWRSPGTDQVGRLFTDEATYLVSPWAEPFRGIEAIRDLWDAEDDAGRSFTMTSDVVAVDGDVAVVRVEVEYAVSGDRWRDLWVLRFAEDGRCSHFEEWPFAPEQPDGHQPGAGGQRSDALVEQAGVDVVQESADGDRLRDQRV